MTNQVTAPYNIDTLGYDLLVRVQSIQQIIPGIGGADPRWWIPAGQEVQFRRFRNRIASIRSDHTQGRGVRVDILTVMMLLVGGGSGVGYTNEAEDWLNSMYYAVLGAFDNRPHLNDPTSGVAFTHLFPSKAARILATNGIEPWQELLVIKFPLEVNLRVPVPGIVS